jgi:hypothetical protein
MEEFLKLVTGINETLEIKTAALDKAIEKDSKALQVTIDTATAEVTNLTNIINEMVSQGRLVESGPLRLRLTEAHLAVAKAKKAFFERQVKYDSDRAYLHGEASLEIGKMLRPAEEKANELSRQLYAQVAELRRNYDRSELIGRNDSDYDSPNSRQVAKAEAEIQSVLKSNQV